MRKSAQITALLADYGQDPFMNTSMIFANDRHGRVAVGERERVKVKRTARSVPQGGSSFPASGDRGALGGHVQFYSQDHQEASDAGGS
jgi:hypothetical protein